MIENAAYPDEDRWLVSHARFDAKSVRAFRADED
jgi:hypothetical protein